MNSQHVDGPLFQVTSINERLKVGLQLKNNINYQKRAARKKGLLTSACTVVDDIVAFKQKYLFNIHASPIQKSPTEPEMKKWGTELYNSHQLNVFKTKVVTDYKSNAYL